jgi:hypothetical protein
MLVGTPEPGFDVTLRIDLEALPAEKGEKDWCIDAHAATRMFF